MVAPWQQVVGNFLEVSQQPEPLTSYSSLLDCVWGLQPHYSLILLQPAQLTLPDVV